MLLLVNFVPNDKILDWSKLKGFADEKINVNEIVKFGLGRVENIMRKCWLPAFDPFPQMFPKALCFKGIKSRDCVVTS